MRLTFLIIITCLTISGCKQTMDEPFYDIINENFLKFTDTVTYKYGRFLVAPNEKAIFSATDTQKLLVLIDTVLKDPKSIASSLMSTLKENNLTEFKQLIDNNEIVGFRTINTERIYNTGRYQLMPSSFVEKVDSSYAGQIVIPAPYIKGDIAIIFFSIHSSPKSGKTEAFLLKKINGQWIIVEDMELERW